MTEVQYTGDVGLDHLTGKWKPQDVRELPDMAAKALLRERPGDMRAYVPVKPKLKARAKSTDGGVENG